MQTARQPARAKCTSLQTANEATAGSNEQWSDASLVRGPWSLPTRLYGWAGSHLIGLTTRITSRSRSGHLSAPLHGPCHRARLPMGVQSGSASGAVRVTCHRSGGAADGTPSTRPDGSSRPRKLRQEPTRLDTRSAQAAPPPALVAEQIGLVVMLKDW
jgi:hypothetical protein